MLALARKYRPRRFADVAVQSHVASTLKGAVERGRVAQGYLLCGPRGVGKTTLARVLAMALNCENRQDGEPCSNCESCQRIWSGAASLDVVEIDAASNRGVDDARELRERAMYAPSTEEHYKVYIVDEAHMLTREAWNTLLKVLEEPPPRVVFVFATTEPHKIGQMAAPVLSRLQRFDLRRMGPADVRERLTSVLDSEQVTYEAEALTAIARAADGSMRDALSLTDQVLSMGDGAVSVERVREALGLVPDDELVALLDIVADRRAADVFPFVARLADAGVDLAMFLAGLADIVRAQLAVVLGGVAPDVSERVQEALVQRKDRFGAADLLRMLNAITDLEPRFRQSGQQQLLLETLLVRLALLDRTVALEDVLRNLSGAGGGGGDGGGRASAGERSRPAAPAVTDLGRPRETATPTATPLAAKPQEATPPTAPRQQPALPQSAPPPKAQPAAPLPQPARSAAAATGAAPSPRTAGVDLNRLTEKWDALVDRLKASGKRLLATAMANAAPVAVTANGEVTIALDEPNDGHAQAFNSGRAEILAILREWFSGIEKIQLRAGATGSAPRRLTDDEIRLEKLNQLKKRSPVLAAAIDALDLDVAD